MRRPTRLRHDGLPPMPAVEMLALRQLCQLVNMLERTEAGEHVPGNALNEAVYRPCGGDGDPILGRLSVQIANLSLAVKRLLAHPLALWDSDPLVIRRESELAWKE